MPALKSVRRTSYPELPSDIYLAEAVKRIDSLSITKYGIDGFELMTRASQSAFEASRMRYPDARTWLIFAGQGNNAGDGYVVAGLAKQAKVEASVVYLCPPHELQGDALKAVHFAESQDVTFIAFEDFVVEQDSTSTPDLIIDALFGIGLNKDLSGAYEEAVSLINALTPPVIALDIPSGLHPNCGRPMGVAIYADMTMTFIGLKPGLLTGQGREYAGEIVWDGLSIPENALKEAERVASLLTVDKTLKLLPPRPRHAHKGTSGRGLLIGGNEGFSGAMILASAACARSGAGLTTVATTHQTCSSILSHCPEVMPKPVQSPNELNTLLRQKHIVAIGPGLGLDDWSQQLFDETLAFAHDHGLPLVLDADALTLLAQSSKAITHGLEGKIVLTPHPGEAARLLDTDTTSIEHDRLSAAREIARQYNAIVVLKGSGTLITAPNREISLCPYGNPGMASGGMGDVLTGVITGLAAQLIAPNQATDTIDRLWEATLAGVVLHAKAADNLAALFGERGLLASDLIPEVRKLANGFTE